MQLLSNNLKHLRKARKLTQKQIADIFCINQSTYDAWENRNIEPSIDKLIEISNFYNISVDELIGKKMLNNLVTLK